MDRSLIKDLIIARYKGGKGSGYFGHAGRPGHRGGSASVASEFVKARDFSGVLFHGTTVDKATKIDEEGALNPNIGSLVSEAYGEYGSDEYVNSEGEPMLRPATFMSDNLESGIGWMTLGVARKLGKSVGDVTDDEIEEHGGLVAVTLEDVPYEGIKRKIDEDRVVGIKVEEDEDYNPVGIGETDYEFTDDLVSVELGDYFSERSVPASKVIKGKDLLNLVRAYRKGMSGAEYEDYVDSLFPLAEYTDRRNERRKEESPLSKIKEMFAEELRNNFNVLKVDLNVSDFTNACTKAIKKYVYAAYMTGSDSEEIDDKIKLEVEKTIISLRSLSDLIKIELANGSENWSDWEAILFDYCKVAKKAYWMGVCKGFDLPEYPGSRDGCNCELSVRDLNRKIGNVDVTWVCKCGKPDCVEMSKRWNPLQIRRFAQSETVQVAPVENIKEMLKEMISMKGGRGSGYFGHAGRPGKRGGSSGGVSAGWSLETIEDFEKVTTFDDPVTGITSSDAVMYGHTDEGFFKKYGATIRCTLRSKEGVKVGKSEIMFTDKVASVVLLQLEEEYQGSGFGSRWIENLEDACRFKGMEKVELHANIDVGGYAWAKIGYDFEERADFYDVITRVDAAWRKRYGVEFPDYIAETIHHSWEIASLVAHDGFRIGRKAMLGSTWHAAKKITQDKSSDGERVGIMYYNSKKSKGA